jgi:hypothetical protein
MKDDVDTSFLFVSYQHESLFLNIRLIDFCLLNSDLHKGIFSSIFSAAIEI